MPRRIAGAAMLGMPAPAGAAAPAGEVVARETIAGPGVLEVVSTYVGEPVAAPVRLTLRLTCPETGALDLVLTGGTRQMRTCADVGTVVHADRGEIEIVTGGYDIDTG